MMKKRIFAVVVIVAVAIVFFFLGYETKSRLDSAAVKAEEEISLFDGFTSETVTQIEVYWLDGSYTIDKKDRIEEILDLLHSMK